MKQMSIFQLILPVIILARQDIDLNEH